MGQGKECEMIVDVPTLVSYVSRFMTLLPGDVISTGARAGVGLGMRPPQCLKVGDVIELGIEQLGESRQTVVAWQSIATGTVCSHPARCCHFCFKMSG
jgi:2,4-diketo-3-deoxy-L-fuconate hydrolase